jgi:hypothetical protein
VPLLGPFQVDPEQLERLGADFTSFVNELLVREGRRAGLLGRNMRIDYKDNTADGGVDATLESDHETTWLPVGKSCWQFKRSDIGPSECAKELGGAAWAHELLKSGASYTLVLGTMLGDQKIERRRSKLLEKAKKLGLISDGDEARIQVLDANALARWASEFPSLAISRMLRAPGQGVIDFATWNSSNRHELQWVPNDARGLAITTIRDLVRANTFTEVHLRGESGVGKTRLVMESLRADDLAPLVVYVADQQSVSGELLGYVLTEGRAAILVVDECGGRAHEKLAERIPSMSALRLVTIGERDDHPMRSPVLEVETMDQGDVERFLAANYQQLGDEGRRFVAEQSTGNIGFAILIAVRILRGDAVEAAELISRGDVERLMEVLLPEGRPFYLATLLALFERIGWERELAPQLEALASFGNASESELRDLGRELEGRGLLTQQGRYRAVTPHPLAVVLAASAWRSEGRRIIEDLLPSIDRDAAMSLFSRVADLGRYEPARAVLVRLMGPDGPFGSLASIEEHGLGSFLVQLAIVAPDETMEHLGGLIKSEPSDDLRAQTGSRRDLVWTLEKLAWHRRTFVRAADALLRLAIAENETWANNATGTWIDLFGALLPGTAALPVERIEYLEGLAADNDSRTRMFVTNAASRGLAAQHEWIAVSGEIQGGALVEPRGSALLPEDAATYRTRMIGILETLLSDRDAEVAHAAAAALISAVHPLIDDAAVSNDLVRALTKLEGDALSKLRTDIEHLLNLHEEHFKEGDEVLIERLRALSDALPQPSALEELWVLLSLRPWDVREDHLASRIAGQLERLSESDRNSLLSSLSHREVPAGWELGRALAAVNGERRDLMEALVAAAQQNAAVLVGYLGGLVERGDHAAFDRFLDDDLGRTLDPRHALYLAVRAPVTEASRTRIMSSARELPVAQAAMLLFGWQRNLSEAEVRDLMSDWRERVDAQADYNAVIDWMMLWLHSSDAIPVALRPVTYELLLMRERFPAMRQQRWDWSEVALRLLDEHGVELARLILDLAGTDHLIALQHEHESQVLLEAAKAQPVEVWREIASRLDSGGWRLQMAIRGWLLHAIPIDVIRDWIGNDLERARVVASVAPVGAAEPTPHARFLLDRFGDDDRIRSSLWGDFISGTWTGPESARLETQIAQLKDWRAPDASEGMRRWLTDMIQSLEARREQVLEEEAERGF